jgi:hypothetical protein
MASPSTGDCLLGAFARSRAGGPAIVAVFASAALLWSPAVAGADSKPAFVTGPAIVGTPVVGSTLTVVATWTGDPFPTAKYTWGRCPPASNTCKKIDHAEAAQYTATASDVGYRLAAVVEIKNKAGTLSATTAPTAVVTALPPAPPPPPPPPPQAPPAPAPLVPAAPAPVSAPSKAPPPTLMRPFPVVRIRGCTRRRSRCDASARGARCRRSPCPRRRHDCIPSSASSAPARDSRSAWGGLGGSASTRASSFAPTASPCAPTAA